MEAIRFVALGLAHKNGAVEMASGSIQGAALEYFFPPYDYSCPQLALLK